MNRRTIEFFIFAITAPACLSLIFVGGAWKGLVAIRNDARSHASQGGKTSPVAMTPPLLQATVLKEASLRTGPQEPITTVPPLPPSEEPAPIKRLPLLPEEAPRSTTLLTSHVSIKNAEAHYHSYQQIMRNLDQEEQEAIQQKTLKVVEESAAETNFDPAQTPPITLIPVLDVTATSASQLTPQSIVWQAPVAPTGDSEVREMLSIGVVMLEGSQEENSPQAMALKAKPQDQASMPPVEAPTPVLTITLEHTPSAMELPSLEGQDAIFLAATTGRAALPPMRLSSLTPTAVPEPRAFTWGLGLLLCLLCVRGYSTFSRHPKELP